MSENFGLSTKTIFHCSRTAFNTFKGTFEGKKFRLRPSFSKVFIQILSCLFELLSKCFQSCCEICILRFQKKILTSFLQNLRIFLQVWAYFYRSFERKVSPLSSKTTFNMFRGTIGEKRFLYCFLSFFLFLSDFFSQFWQKYFHRVVETGFNVSGRNI